MDAALRTRRHDPAPAGRDRRAGQGIVEYGLILAGSALVAVIVLAFFGGTLSAVLDAIADAIDFAS